MHPGDSQGDGGTVKPFSVKCPEYLPKALIHFAEDKFGRHVHPVEVDIALFQGSNAHRVDGAGRNAPGVTRNDKHGDAIDGRTLNRPGPRQDNEEISVGRPADPLLLSGDQIAAVRLFNGMSLHRPGDVGTAVGLAEREGHAGITGKQRGQVLLALASVAKGVQKLNAHVLHDNAHAHRGGPGPEFLKDGGLAFVPGGPAVKLRFEPDEAGACEFTVQIEVVNFLFIMPNEALGCGVLGQDGAHTAA